MIPAAIALPLKTAQERHALSNRNPTPAHFLLDYFSFYPGIESVRVCVLMPFNSFFEELGKRLLRLKDTVVPVWGDRGEGNCALRG